MFLKKMRVNSGNWAANLDVDEIVTLFLVLLVSLEIGLFNRIIENVV